MAAQHAAAAAEAAMPASAASEADSDRRVAERLVGTVRQHDEHGLATGVRSRRHCEARVSSAPVPAGYRQLLTALSRRRSALRSCAPTAW